MNLLKRLVNEPVVIIIVIIIDEEMKVIAKQHLLTKPTEVDPDLLSEVLSDMVKRLIFQPFSPSSPVFLQYLLSEMRDLHI